MDSIEDKREKGRKLFGSELKNSYGRMSGDQSDILDGIVSYNRDKTAEEIYQIVRRNSAFKNIMDPDLKQYVADSLQLFRR